MSKEPTYEELKKRVFELEQVELAKKQTEEELAQLFSMSLDMICIADIKTSTFIKINPAFSEVLGYSEKELLERPFLDFIHPEDLDKTRYVSKQKLQTGTKVINFENRYRCKDNSYRWFSWVSHPDIEKGVTYAVARDITDWKQNEKALKQSKALLDATGRMARVGGWELDAVTLEVTWTEETYRIHEIPLYQKPPLQEAINFFHPEDRPKLERAIQRALECAEPYDLEIRFITAKGSHLWTRTKCQPEMVNGKIVKLRGTFQDITPRKRAEEKYKEIDIKLKEAIKAGNVGLWDWDLVTNKVFYSGEWKSQIGYAEDEITDDFEEWRKRVHPDDLDRTLEKVRKSIDEAGKDHIVEFRFQHKNGSYRWIMAHSSIIADKDGKPIRMVGSHIDITEQKKTEEQLRKSEKKLLSVLDSTPFPIAIVDTEDDRILFWSRSAQKLFGHTATTASEWYKIAYPDPVYRQDVIDRWKPYLEDARKSGKTVNTGEYIITCKDGTERICELYAKFLSDSLIVTFNDITDRKQAENALLESEMQFRQIFENVGVGIAIYEASEDGSDFVFKDINPAGAKMGQKMRADHVGKSVLEVYPGVKDMGLFAVFQEVWKTGVSKHHHTTQYKDEKLAFWVENYVSKLPLGDIMAVYEDVTKQKQAEETLKNLNQALEAKVAQRTAELSEANKELETFTYSVSHDLKAPLRGIDGYSRLLTEEYGDKLDEEGLKFLSNVRQSAAQMNQLIEDLLAYSRMERRNIHKSAININSLIETLISERQHDIESGKIQIDIKLPIEFIHADSETLRQVIGNYLDNAIKFAHKEKQPMVEVGGSENDDKWTIWVKDNGIGFEPEYQDRIFQIFQRLHRIEDYPGTGVGLAIVRKAVERIGGCVWAESTINEGATFYIEIPKEVLYDTGRS